MAFCKTCRTVATTESALTAKRCLCCGGSDYILPGIQPIDLCEYFLNRGRWDEACAALLSARLDSFTLNERHGDLLTKRECAAWVERADLLGIPRANLHREISTRYDEFIADWYCDIFLGGLDQRWQTNANVKANGQTG